MQLKEYFISWTALFLFFDLWPSFCLGTRYQLPSSPMQSAGFIADDSNAHSTLVQEAFSQKVDPDKNSITNLLKNSGFESGSLHWKNSKDGWMDNLRDIRLDTAPENAHSGKVSLILRSTKKWLSADSDPITVQPGEKYRISGFIKFENYVSGRAVIRLTFLNEKGTQVHRGPEKLPNVRPLEDYSLTVSKDTHGKYVELSKEVVVPDGVEAVRVSCLTTINSLGAGGIVHFDDVGLQEETIQPK